MLEIAKTHLYKRCELQVCEQSSTTDDREQQKEVLKQVMPLPNQFNYQESFSLEHREDNK